MIENGLEFRNSYPAIEIGPAKHHATITLKRLGKRRLFATMDKTRNYNRILGWQVVSHVLNATDYRHAQPLVLYTYYL